MHNFDQIIDRTKSGSTKWDKYYGKDILPLWVADMDFLSPPEILNALSLRVKHGIFGYSQYHESVKYDVVNYITKQYNWSIMSDDIIWLPGVVAGINLSCRALVNSNESVITSIPIYQNFLSAPINSKRSLLVTNLREQNGLWQWDLKNLEQQILSSHSAKARLLLLCNPHNPTGRVWTRQELNEILKIVIKYDLLVCSDEIHCDLILDSQKAHIPFASLSPEAASRTITLMSPSKTYNIAGLGCAFAVVSNSILKNKIRDTMKGMYPDVNIMGLIACKIALTKCDRWRCDLLEYLRENRNMAMESLAQLEGEGIKVYNPQSTYLAWIDARNFSKKYMIDNPQQFFELAGVGLSDGNDFGAPKFLRLNFGCPKLILEQALERMALAVKK
jgi:cystathionine beta-lyase